MKNLFTVSMVGMGLFLAAGCGSDSKGGGSGAGARDAYKSGTTQCSDTIKNDLQAVTAGTNDPATIRKNLDAFCTKYKGVACDDKDEQGKPETFKVDDECAILFKKIDGAGNGGGNN